MKPSISEFKQIWLWDFEFFGKPGNIPTPVCMVAKELLSGQTIRLWQNELINLKEAPFNLGHDSLFVSYYAPAELSCHLALGWRLPTWICDLCVEYKNMRNDGSSGQDKSLLGAMKHFNLSTMSSFDKDRMRNLILTGGPFQPDEQKSILNYCEEDVKAIESLLPAMIPQIDLPYALLRGHYLKSVTRMESNGVPIDLDILNSLKKHWSKILDAIIEDRNKIFDVYENGSFREAKFEIFLRKNQIKWPRHPSGKLALDKETFKEMTVAYPEIQPLRELRNIISSVKWSEIQIGDDGRNRVMLSPFSSKTGRNQPSTNKFIFGLPKALRHLIKPADGIALAYIDYSQQEIGIAAAFSKDENLKKAYRDSDIYIAFGKLANLLPNDATKESHPTERKKLKEVVLGTSYGLGAEKLGEKIGDSIYEAKHLLNLHRQAFSQFWKWQDSIKDLAFFSGSMKTVYGWEYQTKFAKPTTVGNFPMQANGAEILRVALCLLNDAGIKVCAPIHDAILIEAPISKINESVEIAKKCMIEASEIVLNGFSLKIDADIYSYPDRFKPENGKELWTFILEQLEKFELKENVLNFVTRPAQSATPRTI